MIEESRKRSLEATLASLQSLVRTAPHLFPKDPTAERWVYRGISIIDIRFTFENRKLIRGSINTILGEDEYLFEITGLQMINLYCLLKGKDNV